MGRRATAMVAGLALASAVSGVAQARTAQHRYAVVIASGSERVEFSNDQGVTGVVSYRFRGRPLKGRAIVTTKGGRAINVAARFITDGRTTASLQGCSDVVHHRSDGFRLGAGPRPGQLRFGFHVPFAADYLHTACPGPQEHDLFDAGAIPTASFAASGISGTRIRFSLTGSKSFRGVGGWNGTTTLRVVYKLVEQSGGVRPATTRGPA